MKLETERLILREWHEHDVDDLVEGLNNLNVAQWLAQVPHPYTEEDARNWISYCSLISNEEGERTNYEFAITLKSEKKVIGGVALTIIDKANGIASGGIWINELYHGNGYGREAFGERIRFAFADLDLRRLEDGFFEGNNASFQMQEKLGYKLEGIKRQKYICLADGALKDEHITGLLKSEWRQI